MIVTTNPPAIPRSRRRRQRSLPRANPVHIRGRDWTALRARVDMGPSLVVDQPWRSSKRLIRIRLAVLLPVLLFSFSLFQNLSNMDTVDFHRDEARWINRAYFLEDLAHPFSDTWADYYTTRGQPPLGNYMMGLGLLLQGRDLDTNRVWDFSYDEAWNVRAGAIPAPADLNAGRRANAVIGALVVVCVYLVTSSVTNRFGGVAAGIFLSLHPLHLRLSSQALSDELLALLLALSILVAFRFARTPSLGLGLVLGILFGLGGAAKLSPLLLSIPLAGFGAVWLVTRLWRSGRPAIAWRQARFGWMLALQPVIAFSTFVVVNPFLWPSPIRRSWALFDFRFSEMELQSSAWPIAGVDGWFTALARTGRRFNRDYSTSLRIQGWIEDVASVSFRHVSIDVVLIAAGLVVLIGIVVRYGLWSPHALAAFLMATEAGAVILGMGVDFYRYFLPLLVVASICVGVGIGSAFNVIQQRYVQALDRR